MSTEKDEILEETAEEVKAEPEKKEKKCSKKDKDNKKIEELENALKESEDKYLRMLAEYDNFKKRTQKEKESLYKEGIADSVEKLLTVLDNLDRAAAVDVEKSDAQSVVDGVNKILEQAKEVFAKMGVEEIDYGSFNVDLSISKETSFNLRAIVKLKLFSAQNGVFGENCCAVFASVIIYTLEECTVFHTGIFLEQRERIGILGAIAELVNLLNTDNIESVICNILCQNLEIPIDFSAVGNIVRAYF